MKDREFRLFLIKALAVFHRYVYFITVIIILVITRSLLIFGIALIIYAVWTFIGYLLKLKHIYCSFQNAYRIKALPARTEMTPDRIERHKIRRFDVYVISVSCFVLGAAAVVTALLL